MLAATSFIRFTAIRIVAHAGGFPLREHFLALLICGAGSNLMTVMSYFYPEGPKITTRAFDSFEHMNFGFNQ